MEEGLFYLFIFLKINLWNYKVWYFTPTSVLIVVIIHPKWNHFEWGRAVIYSKLSNQKHFELFSLNPTVVSRSWNIAGKCPILNLDWSKAVQIFGGMWKIAWKIISTTISNNGRSRKTEADFIGSLWSVNKKYNWNFEIVYSIALFSCVHTSRRVILQVLQSTLTLLGEVLTSVAPLSYSRMVSPFKELCFDI